MKGSIRMLVGFLILAGVAGSGCDGKCMENAMSLTEMMMYGAIGLAIFGWGVSAAAKENV